MNRSESIREVAVTIPLDPYMPLKALAAYSGIAVRTLRQHLRDGHHPLPCYRVGGKVVVRRSEFDSWIAAFREEGDADLDHLVSETLHDL